MQKSIRIKGQWGWLLVVGMVWCMGGTSTAAGVRIVNVLRHAEHQRIDVYVDTEPLPRVAGLGYLGYSEELSLPGGVHEVVIRKAGRSEELTQVSLAVSADSSYTVYVLGSRPEVRVLSRSSNRVLSNDSLAVRYVQVASVRDSLTVGLYDPSGKYVVSLPEFDAGQGKWGDSIGVWRSKVVLAGRLRPFVIASGMEEVRPYSGHYREGSVVTFFAIGEYRGGSGDLGVYSLVETDTGGGLLYRLREKGVGDGAVRPVSLAADLFKTPNTFSLEFTLDGVPVGYDRRWYTFFPRYDDYIGSFNSKFVHYVYDRTKNESTRDTLIDEDLNVGVDTLTTAILVGNQQTGYSVVSLQTPMLYQVGEARSRLRVFHGAASVGGIEVVLRLSDGSSERFGGLRFKGSSEYREVPYGSVVAELYRIGEQEAFARKRGYLPVDSQMTLMLAGPSMDSLGIALLVDTDSNYQSVKFWPDAGATGVEEKERKKMATVAVYPNPTSSNAVLTIAETTNATATVELLTLTGMVLQIWPAVPLHRHSTTLFPISTTELASGTYLLRVQIAGEVVVRPITVVR